MKRNCSLIIFLLIYLNLLSQVSSLKITEVSKDIPVRIHHDLLKVDFPGDQYPHYDQAVMNSDVIVLDNYDFVDIYDRSTGELIKRLEDKNKCSCESFSGAGRIFLKSDESGNDIIVVSDRFTGALYEYNQLGELLCKTDVSFFYNDAAFFDQHTAIHVTYDRNSNFNSNFNFNFNFNFNGYQFVVTQDGVPFAGVGTSPIDPILLMPESPLKLAIYQAQRSFFPWSNGELGYVHPLLDSIFIIDRNYTKKSIALDFSDLGGFTNLYGNTTISHPLEYIYEHNLTHVLYGSRADNLLSIVFEKDRRAHIFFYDVQEEQPLGTHEGFLSSDCQDMHIDHHLHLVGNTYGQLISRRLVDESIFKAKDSGDEELYKSLCDCLRSTGYPVPEEEDQAEVANDDWFLLMTTFSQKSSF